jgi:PAS domain S-box-containing protein
MERGGEDVETDKPGTDAKLIYANRMLRMISACNQMLARAVDETEMLHSICRIAIEQGGYRMAWVGHAEKDASKTVRPVAQAGVDEGYLTDARITWDDTDVRGCGPAGISIRTRRPCIARHIDSDPAMAPWREAALRHGFNSAISLPLLVNGQTFGAWLIYSTKPDAFDESEVVLLTELVHDVAFGIAALRTRAENRRAEEALRLSELKYRELVELANSIILRWTYDGRIVFLNEFGLRFFGYSAEEIVNRHVMDTIVPATDSSGRDLRLLMQRICAAPVAFEQNVNENMRRNGERVWIAWTNRIVRDAKGQVSEILSIGTDITKLKQAEAAIQELNASLEQRVAKRTAELAVAKERAEEADQLKSAFLATMSHELRTPLNSIIGFTGILLQKWAGPLNAEQTKQLGMVQNSSRHLLALINDVLDISKIEARQMQVRAEPFDLNASIVKVFDIIKPPAEKKGLSLRLDLAPEIGEWTSDPRRVEQILLNLLNNAVKFTDRGTVTLTAGIVSDELRISIADTGIGIKPEDLCQLFQPFRQIDTGLTRQHEGTGLGLAICRRLAELLGGKIDAASDWGKGSVFTCTLPKKGLDTT